VPQQRSCPKRGGWFVVEVNGVVQRAKVPLPRCSTKEMIHHSRQAL
jgi:hypothetical protein